MTKYFAEMKTVEELRKRYRELLRKYHPDERFKAILNEIIAFKMTVEVIGSWLWCFSAYEYRTQLKELGFTWCSKKKAWVWHDEPYKRHHKKEIPLSHIKTKYGCQTVRNQSYPYSLN